MSFICYSNKSFAKATRAIIDSANAIIDEYSKQGYDLTLRQLYYQFVARGLLVNNIANYQKLGNIINDARLAGMVNWNAIIDRTRNLATLAHWSSPQSIVESCAYQYRVDKWLTQPIAVEVWVEKEALAGVVNHACVPFDVPYFSCRGYVSQSEMWSASQRIIARYRNRYDQRTHIIHLGDHDPSGVDMSRDIVDRLVLFTEHDRLSDDPIFTFKRIALNRDQIDRYQPPPNPAKNTDARFQTYVDLHGEECWELDALDPVTLSTLIEDEINKYRDIDAWRKAERLEQDAKDALAHIAKRFDDCAQFARRASGERGDA